MNEGRKEWTAPVTESIILAGGLGTRLREAVPDLPKCMAPVGGNPFISYVIDALRRQGVQRFVFSLGYRHDAIEEFLQGHYSTLEYETVVEKEPLGTGGAIALALKACQSENVLIANGDTLFKIDVKSMASLHYKNNAQCTLALKPMQNFERYGVVQTAESGRIVSFREKQFYKEGLINGGIYLLNKDSFLQKSWPQKFSFEKDYLEKYTAENDFYGSVQTGYFIDIGIPEDYEKAQSELALPPLDLKAIDKSWTLFLDRDGVINNERVGHYVLNWEEFHFSEGVLEALQMLNEKVGTILIISNQRGVGRKLMSEDDLTNIHQQMQEKITAAGGRIDGIYYCTEVEKECFFRKPNPGMAMRAFADFPQIDPQKCIMVGNKPSDMRFGRAAGVYTVFIESTNPHEPHPHPDVDARFPTLRAFAGALQS
ncbi:MAG: HAD-IIIA family hydrolase [Chitinophagaceae bacterium]